MIIKKTTLVIFRDAQQEKQDNKIKTVISLQVYQLCTCVRVLVRKINKCDQI